MRTPLTRRSHRHVDGSGRWLGKLRRQIQNEGLQFLVFLIYSFVVGLHRYKQPILCLGGLGR